MVLRKPFIIHLLERFAWTPVLGSSVLNEIMCRIDVHLWVVQCKHPQGSSCGENIPFSPLTGFSGSMGCSCSQWGGDNEQPAHWRKPVMHFSVLSPELKYRLILPQSPFDSRGDGCRKSSIQEIQHLSIQLCSGCLREGEFSSRAPAASWGSQAVTQTCHSPVCDSQDQGVHGISLLSARSQQGCSSGRWGSSAHCSALLMGLAQGLFFATLPTLHLLLISHPIPRIPCPAEGLGSVAAICWVTGMLVELLLQSHTFLSGK